MLVVAIRKVSDLELMLQKLAQVVHGCRQLVP